MVDPQTSRFWQASLQSGLIDVEGLKACWEALPPEKRVSDQLERRLARQAVQLGLLTLWQAQQLLAGRSTGFKINRYVLLEMIGQGGMGRVYLAKDSRLGRRVALKILSPERVNNPRAIARFQREARVGAQLQHENLVRIYDEGEANGKCYLVMEFIEGKNIGSLITEKGPMLPSTAARLARQVALGLEHAQQKGLIHRDVNPFNILVTSDGTAKLADLGLAIDLAEQVQVTREGATVGTFDYISPEQARHSHSVDTRSDIYSLGCTLYHMLAGRVPFPSPSLPEKLFGHQASDPDPLMALVPGIPEGLAAVVERMMRKSPDERYSSPLEVAQALEPFVEEGGPAYRIEVPPGPRAVPPLPGGTQSGTNVTTVRRDPLPVTQTLPLTSAAPTDRPPAPPPTLDLPGLAQTLDLGPEPSLSDGLSSARGRTKAKPPPPPPPNSPPDEAPAVDFTTIGKEPAPKLDLSGLGLALDLGPEPPLSDTLAQKTRPKVPAAEPKPPATSPASVEAPAGTLDKASPPGGPIRGSGLRRHLIVGGAAALFVILVVGGLFASGVLSRLRPLPKAKTPPRAPGAPSAPVAETDEGPESPAIALGTGTKTPAASRETMFTVKAPDGTISKEPDLKSAMQRAIGSRGHVLLDNREPLRISGADAAVRINGGPLYIRAAEGARPVLEVEIQGRKPFLSTGPETAVTLVGVTIVARYAGGSGQPPPPVLEAAGNVTLERSAFAAAGTAQGTRAVSVQGGSLRASGCWFQGFDCPLDIAAFGGSSATIRQCMMVWGRTDGPPAGFAVRVRREPGGPARAGRRLVLERCTVEGGGLLDLVGFSPQAPLQVTVTGCAVLADALLAWEAPVPGTLPSTEALQWSGQGNLYDLRGTSWVVASPQAQAQGGVAIRDSPHDPDSWAKLARETAPVPPPVTFRADLAHLAAAPRPQDFALKNSTRPVGADPAQVGPASKPARGAPAR